MERKWKWKEGRGGGRGEGKWKEGAGRVTSIVIFNISIERHADLLMPTYGSSSSRSNRLVSETQYFLIDQVR